MNIFGGLPSSAFGMSFPAMEQPEEEAPRRRRGGLLGRLDGLRRGGSALDRLLIAQSIANGDIGQAMQMRMGMQRQRALQQQAAAEAAAAEEQYNYANQALTSLGLDKRAIAAMRPEERSRLLLELQQPRQFGPEGGSLGRPDAQGQMQYQQAPWQRQVGRSIIAGGGSDNAAPRPIYEGFEPVSVPDGAQVFGMTGSGQVVGQGGVGASEWRAARNPQTGERIEINTRTGETRPAQGGAGSQAPRNFPGQW